LYPLICKVFSDGTNFKARHYLSVAGLEKSLEKMCRPAKSRGSKNYRDKRDEGPWTAAFNPKGNLSNYNADGSEHVTFKSASIH